METFTVVMAMLVAVLLSGVLVRIIPLPIPLPFAQIALGFLIAAVFQRGVLIEPDIFFLLFLPPLLFLDGWRVPKVAVLREASAILQLALGLVVLTVIGIGFLIHWMIPTIPLAVAFAVAAVVSPTDPVALGAICKRAPIPHRMLHILEGESLLNDASGLVAFRFAVAAAATGTFSLPYATVSFLWVSFAGLAIGAGLTWLVMHLRTFYTRHMGENPSPEVLLSLITPFFVYFVAEHAGASGILAAVAAGVTMSYSELSGRALAVTRMERRSVWDMIQFTLNGMIFVLLGEQFPTIIAGLSRAAAESGGHSLYLLPVYGLVVCLGLVVCRLIWVTMSLKLRAAAQRRRGLQPAHVSMRLILVMSVAGVRGAVTLAGVMTLPFALDTGEPFPARDLAVSLAAMVIVFSMLLASLCLPALLRGLRLSENLSGQKEEALARRAMLHAALDRVAQTARSMAEQPERAALYNEVAQIVQAVIRRQSGIPDADEPKDPSNAHWDIERQMLLDAISASRDAVFQLARKHQISDALARELIERLDLHELHLR